MFFGSFSIDECSSLLFNPPPRAGHEFHLAHLLIWAFHQTPSKTGLWDESPLCMGGSSLGGPFCCIAVVDSISHSPAPKGCPSPYSRFRAAPSKRGNKPSDIHSCTFQLIALQRLDQKGCVQSWPWGITYGDPILGCYGEPLWGGTSICHLLTPAAPFWGDQGTPGTTNP